MTQPVDAAVPSNPGHDFYRSVVDKAKLRDALAVEGIDDEIAVLRLKLRDHLTGHPEDLALMHKSVTLIVRAVAVRYRMSTKRAADLAASLDAAMDAIGGQVE